MIEMFNMLKKHQAKILDHKTYNHISFLETEKKEHSINNKNMNFLQDQRSLALQKETLQGPQRRIVVQNRNTHQKHEQNEMQYNKLVGSKVHLKSQGVKRQVDLSMINHHNTFFTGKVAVSKPDQQFDVIFDTGSALTFINSVACADAGCKKGHAYNAKKSKNHQDLDSEVEVEFGSGVLDGYLATETFFVQGLEVPNTTFIEITKESGDVFQNGDFDGIVGLSFPDYDDNLPTLFDDMMATQNILSKKFAFYLDRNPQNSKSEVQFGGINEKLYEGKLNYHKVVNENFWSLHAQQLLLGKKDTKICSDKQPCKIVIDSGTSLFTGPASQLKQLYQQMQPENGCRNLYDLPDITFVIDGQKYPITAPEYILTVTNKGVEDPHTHSDMKSIVECVGAFYQLDIAAPEGPLWVMGDFSCPNIIVFLTEKTAKLDLPLQKNQNDQLI